MIQASTDPISVLGVIIMASLSMKIFIEKKCDKVAVAVGSIRRALKEAGPADVSLRLRLAQSLILPILDYCAEVHPSTTREMATLTLKAERSIWLLVAGVQMNVFMPNGLAMAWEMGQHGHIFRWRRVSLTFFARCVSLSHHASAEHARAIVPSSLLAPNGDADMDKVGPFGPANILAPLVMEKTRNGSKRLVCLPCEWLLEHLAS